MKHIDNLLSLTPSKRLFQYRSPSGLLRILEKKNLSATEIHYQNDATEFLLAFDLARQAIDKIYTGAQEKLNNAAIAEADAQIKAQLAQGIPLHEIQYDNSKLKIDTNEIGQIATMCAMLQAVLKLPDNIDATVFVCSFTELEDNLSQWRGYCPDGIGFNLGFDYDDLLYPIAQQNFKLAKCLYDENDQKQLINAIVEDAAAELRNSNFNICTIPEQFELIKEVFLPEFLTCAPLLKHNSFKEEQEWRLISNSILPDNPLFGQIKYRVNKNAIVPYLDIPLSVNEDTAHISQITIGPNPHPELSKSCLERLKNTLSMQGKVEIGLLAESKIPYRNW